MNTLPLSGLYAGLSGIIVMVLAVMVSMQRHKQKIDFGDAGNEPLLRAIRAHGNAVENIPICLILLALFELNASQNWAVHMFGAGLVAGRVLHGWGLSRSSGSSMGRMFGISLTWLVLLGLSVWNLALILM